MKTIRAVALAAVMALCALLSPVLARGGESTDPPEVALLLALIERAAPSKNAGTPSDGLAFPGWKETPAQRAGRYLEIARAAWDVAGEPLKYPLFHGKQARIQTAAAILAVAFHESGFARDVDLGPACYRGKGQETRCDSGKAHCMHQLHLTHKGKTPSGYTGAEVFADRRKCFGEGVRELAAAQASCGHKGWRQRFTPFASGSCGKGTKSAEEIADLVDGWSARVLRALAQKEKQS